MYLMCTAIFNLLVIVFALLLLFFSMLRNTLWLVYLSEQARSIFFLVGCYNKQCSWFPPEFSPIRVVSKKKKTNPEIQAPLSPCSFPLQSLHHWLSYLNYSLGLQGSGWRTGQTGNPLAVHGEWEARNVFDGFWKQSWNAHRACHIPAVRTCTVCPVEGLRNQGSLQPSERVSAGEYSHSPGRRGRNFPAV